MGVPIISLLPVFFTQVGVVWQDVAVSAHLSELHDSSQPVLGAGVVFILVSVYMDIVPCQTIWGII